MFSLLLGVVGLGGVSAADDALWPDLSTPPHVGGGSQDAAVIVAIEDYAFVSDIPGAQANARDWYTYMTSGRRVSPGRVQLLLDAQATDVEILQAVESARAQVGSDGTLWFVFIGHGAPSADGQDGLLLGVDVQQTATSVYARGLSQSDLMASLSTGPQSETVVVLDACFSGQTQGGALVEGLQPLIPTYATRSDRMTILSAGSGNEFAGPLPGLSRPAFSYLALGAIRGWGDENGDGMISASEVASYTQGALRAFPLGRTQTPQHAGPDGVLGQGREDGPDLAAIRLSLIDATPTRPTSGPLNVESSGGEGFSSSDIDALLLAQQAREAAEAEEAVLLAKLRRDREAALSAAVSAKQEEAHALWTRMAPLLSGGGPEAQQAVTAFVSAWSDAEVVVEDVEGRHVQAVSAPEVATAQAWLAAQQAASTTDTVKADPVDSASLTDPDEILERAEAHLSAGRGRPAVVLLDRFLELHPDHPKVPRVLYRKAEATFNAADYSAAVLRFQDVIDGHRESQWASWAMVRQGECFDAQGQPENARLFYEDVVRIWPGTEAAKEARRKLRN